MLAKAPVVSQRWVRRATPRLPAEPSGPTEHLPSVTVVICAYTERRWGDLTAAIESVGAQSRPPEQCVLVVDHNPALFSRAVAAFPGVQVIGNRHRRGLAGARNTGIECSRSEVVAFLDDDAVADPKWLEALVAPYADPAINGTGGVARADWVEGRPGWFPGEFDWVVGCSYRGLPETSAPIRNPIGASMSFRRAVFSDVGVFDTEMGRVAAVPLGCEETVVGIRVHQHYGPGTILQVPTASVDHRVGPERANVRYLVRRCFAEGISKAAVARLVGVADASSAEWSYVTSVLPRGVASGLAQFVGGDRSGAARSTVIVLGLSATVLGYGLGRLGLDRVVIRALIGGQTAGRRGSGPVDPSTMGPVTTATRNDRGISAAR